MTEDNLNNVVKRLQPAKLLVCRIPDDGTDITLMRQLRSEKNLTRVNSAACRVAKNLQTAKTRRGKLPEPALGRVVTIVVSEDEAEDIFDFVLEKARIAEPGRGILTQSTLLGATAFALPENIPEEEYDS